MIDTIILCKKVLSRLSEMDCENVGNKFEEKLIFPSNNSTQNSGKRVSEQELRQIFIEEFKKQYSGHFYSIETPTKNKYSFGKTLKEVKAGTGTAARMDMCILRKEGNGYKRILNIEFKHGNAQTKNVGKDILKLLCEKEDGVLIYVLNNTNKSSLYNDSKNRVGVLNKLHEVFKEFWCNRKAINKKPIQIIIMPLKQKTIIHRTVGKDDIDSLEDIFFLGKEKKCNDIKTILTNGWVNLGI